jgi:UDP-N-acetylmuramate--alanine ligase
MMVAFRNFQKIHLVGIGGSGMNGIAEVLLSSGYAVSGSELKPGPITTRLANLGAKIYEGHDASNVHGSHVVVVSSAVRPDNVEIVEAHRLKIPVIPRAEMLAELMRLKYGIAVAGAHGKTTTTSMIASVLGAANLDPTFVVGGRVNHVGSSARLGQGEYMVVEADESDRSFLLLAPVLAVVTTIDREHLDQYDSLEEIQEVFLQFVNRVPFYGSVILCLDEPNVQALLPRVKRPVITYGTSSQADLIISNVQMAGFESRFDLAYRGENLGQFHLTASPGMHNIRNAAAAAAVALSLNIPAELIRLGFQKFSGVGRRFEVKGVFNGVTLIDDYGHHPTLEAARGCGFKRLLVIFQPHRHTRTHKLWEELRQAFNQADLLAVLDIYAAGESPIENVTSELLAQAISTAGHKSVVYATSMQIAIEFLLREVKPGDAILAIGAGSVNRALDQLALLLDAQVLDRPRENDPDDLLDAPLDDASVEDASIEDSESDHASHFTSKKDPDPHAH